MRAFRFVLVFVLLAAINQYAAGADSVASLDPVQGVIQYDPAETPGEDWQIVTQRQLVSVGDRVRTNMDGVALLTFFTGVESEILPNTVIVEAAFPLPM